MNKFRDWLKVEAPLDVPPLTEESDSSSGESCETSETSESGESETQQEPERPEDPEEYERISQDAEDHYMDAESFPDDNCSYFGDNESCSE